MGSKNLTVLVCLMIFYSFITSSINAETPKKSQRWVCLKSIHCWEQKPESSACVIKHGHRALLSAKPDAKPLPSKDTYIVECLATAAGEICTSGSKTTDQLIYGKDNMTSLKTSDNYAFEGLFAADGVKTTVNPVKSKANGDIEPVYWQSFSKGNNRKFLALNYFTPQGVGDWVGKGGEQQATFSFESQSNLKDCVSIAWDPYGRVFDSITLEPIPEASVELLQKRSGGQFTRLFAGEILGGAIENPYVTKQDGFFSFVVPDGIYKLDAVHSDYIFPGDESELNINYSKAYSDIYPNKTGAEVVQKGKLQHRDIPLNHKGGGSRYPVKMIEYFYNLDKDNGTILLEGIVSHPLTKIKAYSLKPSNDQPPVLKRHRLLKSFQTDKEGNFKVAIDQAKFEPAEVFGELDLEKIDLTANEETYRNIINKFISGAINKLINVEAAQSSTATIRFSPILDSIKGYAYTPNNSFLPNTTVGVYVAYAAKPYTETTTDGKGYYEIPFDQLPASQYNLRYTGITGNSQVVTTSKFITQNKKYLVSNKINLNTGSTVNPKVTKPLNTSITKPSSMPFKAANQPVNGGIPQSVTTNNTVSKTQKSNSPVLMVFAILLLLIGGAGVLLGFYVMNKKKQAVY